MRTVRGTVYEAFRESAQRWPQQDFLCVLPAAAAHYGIAAHSYSYAQAAQEVEQVRERYRAAGLLPGQRVGLMLENRPAFFFHWLALNALGVSAVPLNPEWRSVELGFLLGHSEIAVAVVPQARVADLDAAALATNRHVLVTTADLAQVPARACRGSAASATRTSVQNARCFILLARAGSRRVAY